jgi:hypothetical protein
MEKELTLNDSINVGKGKKKVLVSDIVNIKGEVFKYIKQGYLFDDEVLKLAHITKHVGPVTIKNEIVERKVNKIKEYPKETESLKNILKSLNTIENQSIDNDAFTKNDKQEDNVLDLITQEEQEEK